ncbi:MAG: hypothetical protein RIR65_1460 [Planctomycetota bacterium]
MQTAQVESSGTGFAGALRLLLIAAVVLLPIVLSFQLVPHHGDNQKPFEGLYMHVVPAPLMTGHGPDAAPIVAPLPFAVPMLAGSVGAPEVLWVEKMPVTNLQMFQIAAVLLIFVCFSGVPGHLRRGGGDYVSRLFAGFALWVRDEMVAPVMGREQGNKLLPYFLAVFFFVLFMNVFGLLPGSATATASIFVTAALALTTLIMMIGGGMAVQGPVAYWKHLVPHVPLAIWPLMFVVELVGVFVKPFALMIRLFANMAGGHLVVLSFMGLLFLAAGVAAADGGVANAGVAWGISPLVVGFSVFIMIVESFVALLQAYVFTMLSILFIQASLHPEH